jgi:hypothetical protein
MKEFPERMLIEFGRGALRMDSSNDRGREINIDDFHPNGFDIVDFLPRGDSLTAQDFVDLILKPLSH